MNMQQPIIFRSQSRREPGDVSIPFARHANFVMSSYDTPEISHVPYEAEWLYYPREFAEVLDRHGVSYEIYCHSGDVICGWTATDADWTAPPAA